ncbi:MAG: hypothetical protein ABI663_21325, partial [Chryseolinea sp.]
MKLFKKLLRHYRVFLRALVFLMAFLCMSFTTSELNDDNQSVAPAKGQTIMLALLLDTSNSMDGLIDQAKSQLWRIVNEVAAAKSGDGTQPNI